VEQECKDCHLDADHEVEYPKRKIAIRELFGRRHVAIGNEEREHRLYFGLGLEICSDLAGWKSYSLDEVEEYNELKADELRKAFVWPKLRLESFVEPKDA